MLCTTASEWQNAIGRVQKKVADLPSLAQFQVAQEALFSWQWAKATWSKFNTDDYWTGRYRGSVTISVGGHNSSALPPHPEAPPWPEHPGTPYEPAEIDALMASVRPAANPPTVFISVTLDYADKVEGHVHPRALAWEAAAHHPYNWQALIGSLTS